LTTFSSPKIEIGRSGVWPEGYLLSSGKKTSSGIILAHQGIIGGVTVKTDGTNDVTVTIYNNTSSASGEILVDLLIPGADKVGGIVFGTMPVLAPAGIFLSYSGTGGSCIVYFR
jgi:hypothetical protein